MWKNTVMPDSPWMTWCMRIACWIPKATHTLTTCNTYCFSSATRYVSRTLFLLPLFKITSQPRSSLHILVG